VGPTGPRWLFLDEPVASLDIAHQIAVMEIARAYAARGGGVVAVMHDLNLTAMYAARVTVMSGGLVAGAGPGDEVLRDELLSSVYGCPIRLGVAPEQGSFFLPQACRTA
jgi:iron complex transport system ATP-binding protein